MTSASSHAHEPADTAADDDGASLRIDIERGKPTAEDIAAVIAVVSDAYATEAAGALADDGARPSAWQVSARALRQPLRRDLGWGVFDG